jgi:hypothetical protein
MTSLTSFLSRTNRFVLVIGIVCLVTTFVGVIFVAARNDDHHRGSNVTTTDPSLKARVADHFGRLPLSFEVNKGQLDQPVKFLSHGRGYQLFLTANEAVLTLRQPQASQADTKMREGSVLRLKMIGANTAPQIEGQDELPGKVNYFPGNDPEKWRRNIPTYRKVYYKNVYPGIDVVYYGNQRELEYDFVVAPGADPKVIKFTVEGADKIRLDQAGNLLLNLKHGEVRLHKPLIYQLTDEGNRREVMGNYVIKGSEVKFNVQRFDSGKPLVIDPILSYSTFLGSIGGDFALGIAVDSQGNAYVTGNTTSSSFPTTTGAFKTTSDSGGVFVSKLNSTGSALIYSTFLSSNSTGRSIAVDASGNAYVTGNTAADDFPTVNGLKTGSTFGDAFVTKLNSSGSALLFSTLLGGTDKEFGNGIAVDANGNIYVVGETFSADYPKVNPIQSNSSPTPFCGNGFVTKLNPFTPSYLFSTHLGGDGCDAANGVALDSSGNVYVTGQTSSLDFPTANAFQKTFSGFFGFDAFVTKLMTNGVLAYSTYLGGTRTDTGFGIAVDASGNAYVTGTTTSVDFPTLNPIQATGEDFFGDVFVTKLNSQGSGLVYSTYLGGAKTDIGRGIATDSLGNAYITGITGSVNFPLTQGAIHTRSSIFKSIDGAASWSNDNYGLAASSVTHIVVNPSQPWILYAGTEKGVFKSTNRGRTWSAVNNGLNGLNVVGLVIDPLTPSTLYVAVDSFSGRGVYKTTDGGNSWNLRSNGMADSNLLSLAIDPVTPTTLYAGVLGGPVYKTADGADSWTAISDPPFLSPVEFAVDPLNHATVYAAQASSPGGVTSGIFRSTTSGATWQSVGFSQTGPHARWVSVSPLMSGLLYTQTDSGIFKSTDGGDNWSPVQSLSGVSGKIVFDPVNSSTLYFLAAGFVSFDPNRGVLKSTDNGQTWIPISNGFNVPAASALAFDPQKPSTLHLAAAVSGGDDAFVTKLNPAGGAVLYSTFIGGTFPSANVQGFGIALDSAGDAYVTGLAFSANFPTTPNVFQSFNRGDDGFISKLSMSYLIGGRVLDASNAPVDGVEVILNDGSSVTSVTTEGDGSYQFSRLREGGSFTVSATKPSFTITPSSQTFNNLNSDQVLNFTATAATTTFFTISGQVTESGTGLPGVIVTLSGSQSGLRTTDSNGNYSFELAGGGNYTVTPSSLGFTFTAPSQTFNNLSAPQTANFAATRQSFVVTNDNSHGSGSLRDAILKANGTFGRDTIVFNISGSGVKVIRLLEALPEITDPVVIDGTTQPGYTGSPLIELDGTLIIPGATGLVIKAGGSTVKGLAIGNFSDGTGLLLSGCNNNVIQGNHIGIDATGTTSRPNDAGIVLSNSSNNLIGGPTSAARYVISSNRFKGLEIGGSGNTVQGNFIGANAAGTADAGPAGFSTLEGIRISGPSFTDNVIGGTAPGAGNLISGNQRGISSNASGTIIQGNLIGTDVTGTKKVPNLHGIDAVGTNILVGGLTPGARNVISGNNGNGVILIGSGSKLQGNYIGTDITGTHRLANSVGVLSGTNTLIGGTVPGARNVIAGNFFTNLTIGSDRSGSGVTVQGNYIGTDATGTRALASGSESATGIFVTDGNHLIGGTTPGAGNVISGNLEGIRLGEAGGPQPNTIQGNLIGLNALGTGPLPNLVGVEIVSAAMKVIVGGTQSGAANKIAFNDSTGILVFAGSGYSIRGNSIFSNGFLGIDLGGDGPTVNDPTDSDEGANLLQNFPVLTSVQTGSSNTRIQGSLKSTPNTTFQIDFYSNAALDPLGNGEGALFFNTTSVNTNGNGDATIDVTFANVLATGRVITATATDPNGNTSEFSSGDETAASGSAQFAVSRFQVNEDLNLATITVLRTGGSAGSISVDYATEDGTAIAGQDYTSTSGTLSFGNGETIKTFQIPILNDATTEPDETFTVLLRASNPEMLGTPSTIVGTVISDDDLELILEEPGPEVNQAAAAALDAFLFTRDPFHIMSIAEWLQGSDRNTRVLLFARHLELNFGEPDSAVIVRLVGSNNQIFDVPAEAVRAVPNTEFTQVVIRLPDTLSPGICTLTIRAHGSISNTGTFRIAP